MVDKQSIGSQMTEFPKGRELSGKGLGLGLVFSKEFQKKLRYSEATVKLGH